MHDHITVIEQKPALLRLPFDAAFLFVIFFRCFQDPFRERVQHAIAGAVAEYEIVGKGCDVLDVQKQDVFALPILQGFNDFMC